MVTLVKGDGGNSESGRWGLPSTKMVSWYVKEVSGIQGGVKVTLIPGVLEWSSSREGAGGG